MTSEGHAGPIGSHVSEINYDNRTGKVMTKNRCIFLDLPAEIRNHIYTWLLYANKTMFELWACYNEIERYQLPAELPMPRGRLMPFSEFSVKVYWSQPRNICIWHKEPVIWQLNRQIRAEARSLYINQHLTINARPSNEASLHIGQSLPPVPDPLFRWANVCLPLQERKAIKRLQLEGAIEVSAPSEPQGSLVQDLLRHLGESMWTSPYVNVINRCSWLPAFEISISDSGKTISVRTPLRLKQSQSQIIQAFLDHRVSTVSVSRPIPILDGDDILDLAMYLRATDCLQQENGQDQSARRPGEARFRMNIEEGDMATKNGKFSIGGFTYLAARACVDNLGARRDPKNAQTA